jgi:hypothetical protein
MHPLPQTNDAQMRADWTQAIAHAFGTVATVSRLQAPAELTRLFDDAMRVHVCETAPSERMVDAMEEAWWATEYAWDASWSDDEPMRVAYEAWSRAFSDAHELLLRWLEAQARQE